MSLDAVKKSTVSERNQLIQGLIDNEEHFVKWVEHSCSYILHHDERCCEEARLWFLAYARSMEIDSLSQYTIKAPTWLSKRFTQWPISWCQLVKEEVVDCGVFAALAREVFKAQGLEAHPAQALLSYNETCTNHWKDLWKRAPKDKKKKRLENEKSNLFDLISRRSRDEPVSTDEKKKREIFPWIGTQIVYHELCVLEMPDGTAKVYDSTWGNWYLPEARAGYGALLAIRTECPRLLRWGDKLMACGEWIDL
jgi:hypothetical protein